MGSERERRLLGTATALWKADGSKPVADSANAWLPYTISPGKVYALSLDVNPDISTGRLFLRICFDLQAYRVSAEQ